MQSCLKPDSKTIAPLCDVWTLAGFVLSPSCREFLWQSQISQHSTHSYWVKDLNSVLILVIISPSFSATPTVTDSSKGQKLPPPSLCHKDLTACGSIDLWIWLIFQYFSRFIFSSLYVTWFFGRKTHFTPFAFLFGEGTHCSVDALNVFPDVLFPLWFIWEL